MNMEQELETLAHLLGRYSVLYVSMHCVFFFVFSTHRFFVGGCCCFILHQGVIDPVRVCGDNGSATFCCCRVPPVVLFLVFCASLCSSYSPVCFGVLVKASRAQAARRLMEELLIIQIRSVLSRAKLSDTIVPRVRPLCAHEKAPAARINIYIFIYVFGD